MQPENFARGTGEATHEGVGEITALALLAFLPELGKTAKAKIATLAGIPPFGAFALVPFGAGGAIF